MGCEIFSMWQNLGRTLVIQHGNQPKGGAVGSEPDPCVAPAGEHKLSFIPAMIGPFLEVTLVPQPDLRNVMIPIFHDMMDWEQRRSGNFKQVL